MAKTTNPDIFLVKPTWVQRVIDGSARTVWYLKMLDQHERRLLTNVGATVVHTTQAGREVTIKAVPDVTPGTTYEVRGEQVTIPEREDRPTGDAPKKRDSNEAIHQEAHAAGMKAGEDAIPEPMVVVERANAFDDNSPIVKKYEPIMEGVCGFAWVNVRPGTCSFARWARERGIGRKAYYGGLDIWVSQFGQSMTRKEAYARAYANVLKKHGIRAVAGSRMD